MGQVGDKYLEKWDAVINSEESQDLRIEFEEVYTELTDFLSEKMLQGRVDRSTIINMCYGLIIHHTARLGSCPACEMYQASVDIHDVVGCVEIH